MGLYYVGIIRYDAAKIGVSSQEFVSVNDLGVYGLFDRENITTFMTFFAKKLAENATPGKRQVVTQDDKNLVFHIFPHERGACGVIISDLKYPSLAAHSALSKVVNEFVETFPANTWNDVITVAPSVEAEGGAWKGFFSSAPKNDNTNQRKFNDQQKDILAKLTEYRKTLQSQLAEFQDPANVDTIGKIQKELNDTKAVLHQTIESVLERQGKLDDLVHKSNDLSQESKAFYTKARKQNSCCVLM